MERFFPYEFDERLRVFWWPFGVRSAKDGVRVDEESFEATFGRLRLRTARANVTGAHVTGDYRWWTAAGARLSFADDGLTFGTNARAGVCVHFARRVGPVLGLRPHSALTVTVADPDGLAKLLG